MVKNKKSALVRGVERKPQEKLDSAIRKTRPFAAGGPIDKAKSPSNADKEGDQDQRSKARFCPIVGIGASAGGLLAFTQLLAHLPADTGMAFVLVQHLDPRHESILAELLSSHTQMPVVQVEQGMTVEPDHIYVIPPNREMTISQRVLTLTPRSDGRERYMPIDFFLCTLAEDQRSNAIGVILSGTATDGILGLKAIKSAGGVTFAQDDKSAQYDEMPRSAVATGSVDFISPPEGIAKELASIASHPYPITSEADSREKYLVDDERDIQEFLAVLRADTGVDFTHYKQATIHHRFQDFEIEHEFEHTGWRILLLNARRIHQDGGTGLILLAMEDITDRKQAAEARYRRLFEAARDGIVILDADSGAVAEVNPVAVALLGYSREELLGKKLWDIDPLKDDEAIQSGFQELLQKGIIRYPDLTLKAKDGRRTDVEIVGNVYREGDKKVVQFNIRDITARKRAEENLRVTEEQLRQALKMEAVGRLTGGVAHDFNNVLEAILGYSDLMLSRLRKEPLFNPEFVDLAAACRKDLQEIVKAGTKAASLTRQLLAFGRKQVLQTKVLDLNAVVTDINEMLRRVISEDIELINNLDPALGRTKADSGQIEQVILNLAINSRDAMPKGGKLKIETANVDWDARQSQADLALESGRYVMLAVSDTGSGMDAETRSHLFEPFFTTKPKGAGTGLGLSTVYGIVQQSGGTICVCSEPGIGTSLKIYFPRVDEPAELDQHEAPSSPPCGSETILVVEDDDGVRALAGELIRRGGYTVLEASGGVDAIRICEQYQGPIHLMLTDVIMPRMSGVELAEGVANLRPKMKVLFMSGHPEDAIVAHGVLNSDTAFLPKPFTAGALAIRIREVLGGALRDTSQPNRKRIVRDVPAVRLSKKG